MQLKKQSELFDSLELVGVQRIKHEDIEAHTVLLSFESRTSDDVLSIQVSIPEEQYDEYEFVTHNGERVVIMD